MLQEILARAALWASMETLGRSAHRMLLSAAKDPRPAQESALREIVRLCVPTSQGQRFGLARVDGVDAFRAAVPIQTYEDIRPAIEREIQSGALEIAPEPPLMYARTSGTTGKPKYIPVTPTTLRQSQTAQRAMAYAPHAALPIRLSTLWPNLRAVVTWLGGGCAIAAQAVRAQLPPQGQMMDAGYVASELRGTVVVDVTRGLALPMLRDVFFEFVLVNDWDAGVRETRLLHELEDGQDYHIIVTTAAGLLRYHMNDVMRVTGRVGATPTLAFIRKGRGVTNIVGEKVSEDQVHAAVVACWPEPPRFYVALADTAAARYLLWVEPANSTILSGDLAASIDAKLAHLNIEYAAKRGSGRLHPLQVRVLRRGAGEAYHRHLVEQKGQREAQAKVLALQTVEEFDFDLSAFEIVDAVA